MITKKHKTEFLNTFKESFEGIFTGSIAQWANENISLPANYAIQGKFDVALSPYLKPIFDVLRDNSVQQVNLVAATQTGKTLISELYIPYIIANDPGPTLRLHQSDEMAKYFTETRLIPLLNNCKPIKSLLDNADRFATKVQGINLPHMSIKIAGAKENVLHGGTIRYLLMDECWLLTDPDTIQKAKARTTAFGNNKKIVLTSQPGIEGDPLDREHTGKVFEWGWKCKCCNNVQPWYWSKEKEDGTWAGIVWDKHYLNAESSSYDYEKTGETAKLQCYYCTTSYEDTEVNRKYLNDNGEYMLVKDNGNPNVHTYAWAGFVNPRISFREKCIEYLQATEIHKKMGLTDRLRLFRQQVLGQTWKRNAAIDVSKVLVQTFNPDEEWKEQVFKTLVVDYQKKYGVKFWTVVAFSPNEIRVLDHGFCLKWDEINDIAIKYNIAPPAVGVDSGYNASEVYLESYNRGKIIKIGKKVERWGWTCLKGDDCDEGYSHKMADGSKLTKYHSPLIRAALNNQQFARLYQWGNYPIKTIFYHIREGKSDMKFVLPKPDPDFTEQLNAESLVEVEDTKTGLSKLRWEKKHDRNHYLDCICMSIVMCMMAGKFGPDPITLASKPVPLKK